MDKMKNVCYVMLLVVVVSGSWVTAEGSEPIPGMISYWTFDEGEGDMAYDSLGNNDGYLNDPCWATGQIGGALAFNGVDDYVDLGTDSSLKPDLPITFSAWIKRSSTGGVEEIVSLGHGGSVSYVGAWFAIVFDELTVVFGDGTGSSTSDRRTKTGTTNIGAGTWYHVTGIIRGSLDMDLYVNGNNDGGTYSGSGGSLKYADTSYIGGVTSVFGPISTFDGVIDDVAVFNRALTPEEIKQIYQDGLAGLGYELDQRQVAINKIEGAIAKKTEAIELVNLAIEKERAAFRALNELKDSGELGTLDIFKARLEILWAMGRQIHAKFNLRRSIRKLERVLDRLTMEPEPEAGSVYPEGPVRLRGRWWR